MNEQKVISKFDSQDIMIEEASFLADLIINKYTSKEGGIFERVDVREGEVLDYQCAIDELGDYIQYIIYLGLLTGTTEYVDWGIRTINLISQSYQSDKGLFFKRPYDRNGLLRNSLLSLDNADTITGLVSSYIFTKEPSLKDIIYHFIKGACRYFTYKGYLTYGYMLGDKVPVYISSLLFAGYFVEEALTFMEVTGDYGHLKDIEQIINCNLESPYFLSAGLFQARIPLGARGAIWNCLYRVAKREDLRSTFLTKDNIYFLFALLRYYLLTKDSSIKETIINVYNKYFETFVFQKNLYNIWNPDRGVEGNPSSLALSHSVMELQLDLFHDLGNEKYLLDAVDMAERWIERKSSLGVIDEKIQDDFNFALLDPNVDFAINLLKLAEKTGNKNYMEIASEILTAVIKYFKAPAGYYWKIDTLDGTPTQSHIETKYLGLLLKLFLVTAEYEKNNSIFNNPLIRNLAKDR